MSADVDEWPQAFLHIVLRQYSQLVHGGRDSWGDLDSCHYHEHVDDAEKRVCLRK